jgi:hypothetical protein
MVLAGTGDAERTRRVRLLPVTENHPSHLLQRADLDRA